ncbi:MAG: FkbM family methyltransferase [Dinghuibacter sp.]|nr:FkbM family methyltransferase [Dinghuibacter sp.]
MKKFWQLLGRQTWIPFGIRNRIIGSFVNKKSTVSKPFSTKLNGYIYNGNFNTYIDWHVYYFGVYERGFLAFLEKIARQIGAGTVMFDVGANVGHHTLYMSPYCSKIYSFEPNPDSYGKLMEKITVNRIEHVTAFPFGLSTTNETLNFYVPEITNSGSASFEDRSSWGHRKITAEVKIGDEAVAAAGIARLDLVKIDVEGFEKNVLEGLKGTIARFRPLVFFEFENSTVQKFASEEEFYALFPEKYRFVKVYGDERRQASVRPFSFMHDGAYALAYPEEKEMLIKNS